MASSEGMVTFEVKLVLFGHNCTNFGNIFILSEMFLRGEKNLDMNSAAWGITVC